MIDDVAQALRQALSKDSVQDPDLVKVIEEGGMTKVTDKSTARKSLDSIFVGSNVRGQSWQHMAEQACDTESINRARSSSYVTILHKVSKLEAEQDDLQMQVESDAMAYRKICKDAQQWEEDLTVGKAEINENNLEIAELKVQGGLAKVIEESRIMKVAVKNVGEVLGRLFFGQQHKKPGLAARGACGRADSETIDRSHCAFLRVHTEHDVQMQVDSDAMAYSEICKVAQGSEECLAVAKAEIKKIQIEIAESKVKGVLSYSPTDGDPISSSSPDSECKHEQRFWSDTWSRGPSASSQQVSLTLGSFLRNFWQRNVPHRIHPQLRGQSLKVTLAV